MSDNRNCRWGGEGRGYEKEILTDTRNITLSKLQVGGEGRGCAGEIVTGAKYEQCSTKL